jgi:DNA-binding response OmpR family regulator
MARILVVDDEPDIVRFAVAVLEARGHFVTTAGDGRAALTAAVDDKPDAILLDLHLPHVDGREVCRRLKADERTASIPVVMMTANQLAIEDVVGATALGADEYLLKPFLRDVLISNIERHLDDDLPRSPKQQ